MDTRLLGPSPRIFPVLFREHIRTALPGIYDLVERYRTDLYDIVDDVVTKGVWCARLVRIETGLTQADFENRYPPHLYKDGKPPFAAWYPDYAIPPAPTVGRIVTDVDVAWPPPTVDLRVEALHPDSEEVLAAVDMRLSCPIPPRSSPEWLPALTHFDAALAGQPYRIRFVRRLGVSAGFVL